MIYDKLMIYNDLKNELYNETLKRIEVDLFEQKVADCTFARYDFDFKTELKKMQQVLDDNTEVLLCSPNMKEKLSKELPMCEFIVSNMFSDDEVYIITDKKMKNEWLKIIRGDYSPKLSFIGDGYVF